MKELATGGVPDTVRDLKLARQPYLRWLERPVTDAEFEQATRANALFDAYLEDPEFGYRFLADEARSAGSGMADRTAWRICRDNNWWSVFGKKRGRIKKAGPSVHDDLVRRDFTATAPNRLWLTDITEHATSEGKLYLRAIKDVFSKRIVGYSIDTRMKSRLAVTALNNAVARRGHVAGCILHSDRGSQGGFNRVRATGVAAGLRGTTHLLAIQSASHHLAAAPLGVQRDGGRRCCAHLTCATAGATEAAQPSSSALPAGSRRSCPLMRCRSTDERRYTSCRTR
ncbi:transposase [Streptomyces sp. NPDC059371]|uniref:transposase n=1 Tax=Streptomyces sp. NPDC059371 TaxID=3346812 RepID=UPI0036AC2E1C